MNHELKKIILLMFTKRIIGEKHFPKERLFLPKVKHLNKHERKEIEKEFDELVKNKIILLMKKRTGKGSDWHISLNPETLEEIKQILND